MSTIKTPATVGDLRREQQAGTPRNELPQRLDCLLETIDGFQDNGHAHEFSDNESLMVASVEAQRKAWHDLNPRGVPFG